MVKATNANLLQELAKVNGATFFFDVHMQCFELKFVGIGQYLRGLTALSGKRAATTQTLFATAKLNGIEPYAWLKDTLEKLPTWPHSRFDELLSIKPLV